MNELSDSEVSSGMNAVTRIIKVILMILFLFLILNTIYEPLIETLLPGVDINTGTTDAYEACIKFSNNNFRFDVFVDGVQVSAKKTVNIAEKLTAFIGNGGSLKERWLNARIFCGASMGLVEGADSGNLEERVEEINELYEPYGANFDFEAINEQVENSRKNDWIIYIMTQVSVDFGLMEV